MMHYMGPIIPITCEMAKEHPQKLVQDIVAAAIDYEGIRDLIFLWSENPNERTEIMGDITSLLKDIFPAMNTKHYYNSEKLRHAIVSRQPDPINNPDSPKVSTVLDIVLPPEIAELALLRLNKGEPKYKGVPLRFENGRDALMDMFQDLMDSINYTIQASWLIEGELSEEYDRRLQLLTDVAVSVRNEWEARHGSKS